MKTKLISLTLGILLFLIVFVLMQNGKEITPLVSARSPYENISTKTPYSPSIPGVSDNALQKYAHTEVVSSSAHGIQISVANFRIVENMFEVDTCFQYPNNGDWKVGEAIIQTQSLKIPLAGGRPMEVTQTLNGEKQIVSFLDSDGSEVDMVNPEIINNDGLPDYRCDTLFFRLSPDLMPSRVKLTIKYISALPSEGKGCREYREATQSILKSKGVNIKIDCSQNDPGSSTRTRFIIVEKPNSMYQEEAEKQVRAAYRESYTIQGPWVFESEVVNMNATDPAATVAPSVTELPIEVTVPPEEAVAPTP